MKALKTISIAAGLIALAIAAIMLGVFIGAFLAQFRLTGIT